MLINNKPVINAAILTWRIIVFKAPHYRWDDDLWLRPRGLPDEQRSCLAVQTGLCFLYCDRKWCKVPLEGQSSSTDRWRRLLTHALWALYSMTPFHTYLMLNLSVWLQLAWLYNTPLPLPHSFFFCLSVSVRLANSRFSPWVISIICLSFLTDRQTKSSKNHFLIKQNSK